MKSTATGPEISSQRALDLVTRMMAIPGKSCEEGRVADFIREELRLAGVPESAVITDQAHKKSPAGGELGNLIVKLPGTTRGPRRLLMAHMDTVPLCVGARPMRKGNTIVARDAHTALGADDRAGASVVLNAMLEIQRQKLPHPPLTLFWPVQEEIGLLGARFVNAAKLGSPKLCFNWDGGDPSLATIGATGAYRIRIDVEGIASHAGVHPELGVSAIAIAGTAIADLAANGWHGLIIKGKETGTSNIGIIEGGDATNVVTPKVTVFAETRSHSPTFRKRILNAFTSAFEKAAKSIRSADGKTGKVKFDVVLQYESFRLKESEPVVQTAMDTIRQVGLDPVTKISNGGLDANWLTAHGFPTVTLGCGQAHVHTVNETLHIDHYLHACRIGLLLATGVS